MRRSLHSTITLTVLAGALLAAVPRAAEAQLLDRIRKNAKAKVDERVVKKANERIVQATGEVVDSATEKTARGIDTAVARGSSAASRVVEGTERAVTSLVNVGDDGAAVATQLAAGRLVLGGLAFTADGGLEPSSHATLRHVARAINAAEGTFLIEGHVGADAGAAAQPLSEVRARAVKVQLVGEGVDAARLFVLGAGTTRPPTGAGTPAERIEIARMQ